MGAIKPWIYNKKMKYCTYLKTVQKRPAKLLIEWPYEKNIEELLLPHGY